MGLKESEILIQGALWTGRYQQLRGPKLNHQVPNLGHVLGFALGILRDPQPLMYFASTCQAARAGPRHRSCRRRPRRTRPGTAQTAQVSLRRCRVADIRDAVANPLPVGYVAGREASQRVRVCRGQCRWTGAGSKFGTLAPQVAQTKLNSSRTMSLTMSGKAPDPGQMGESSGLVITIGRSFPRPTSGQ
jgi:hypothetical protein